MHKYLSTHIAMKSEKRPLSVEHVVFILLLFIVISFSIVGILSTLKK